MAVDFSLPIRTRYLNAASGSFRGGATNVSSSPLRITTIVSPVAPKAAVVVEDAKHLLVSQLQEPRTR